ATSYTLFFSLTAAAPTHISPLSLPDALPISFGHAGVEQVPQLGPLPPRVPAVLAVAEGEHALLGARFLLVAAGAADGGVVAAGLPRPLRGRRLYHPGVPAGALAETADAWTHSVRV